MSRICLFCQLNKTPDDHNRICDSCYDNAGDSLARNAELFAAARELLALAKTFRGTCEERISLLEDERSLFEEEASRDIDDQIGHWTVLHDRCERTIHSAEGYQD